MTGAVPRVLGGVPVDDAAKVGTDGGTFVELPSRVAIDRDLPCPRGRQPHDAGAHDACIGLNILAEPGVLRTSAVAIQLDVVEPELACMESPPVPRFIGVSASPDSVSGIRSARHGEADRVPLTGGR